MGTIKTITHNTFPKQTIRIGQRVKLCFHYDTYHSVEGIVVREDAEEPFRTIFRLDNRKYVLSTECQYQFI